jgi:hypothetical protein
VYRNKIVEVPVEVLFDNTNQEVPLSNTQRPDELNAQLE